MREQHRELFRIARWLERMYAQRARADHCEAAAGFRIGLPHHVAWARRRAELLDLAVARGWDAAAARARQRYHHALQELSLASQRLIDAGRTPAASPLTAVELYHELAAAVDDFGEIITLDGRIAVLTDAIRLEGVELGSFFIQLDPERVVHYDPERWYRVVAQEPHISQIDSDVTHPHVSNHRLCAGEAATAIRAALLHGRLSEFFLLVRSVLGTYNPGSAYVRLDAWDGVCCTDCGDTVSEGELCFCPVCEQDYCGDCMRSCTDCSSDGCRNCLTRSDVSDDWVCSDCLTRCDGCGSSAARGELEENGLCTECHDNLEEETTDDDASDSQSDLGAAADARITPAA